MGRGRILFCMGGVTMTPRLERTGVWLALLLALTILILGAREAWASTHSATCMDDGWTFLGWKPSAEACYNACEVLHTPDFDSRWGEDGCCRCLF
jgi:hypothetical protein